MNQTAPAPTSSAATPQLPVRRIRWGLAALLLALVLGGIVGLGLILRTNNVPTASTQSSQQLASLRSECQQWSTGSAPMLGNASAGSACSGMSDWMGKHLSDGQMTGSMMWGNATALRSTCGQWMTTANSGAAGGNAWCDQMVSWMTQHAGNWDQWMMGGRMMGQ